MSHILCACDPRDAAARAKALARAKGLLALLEGNPKGFAALAARESDCGSKVLGRCAWVSLVRVTPFPSSRRPCASLAEGEISAEPVLTRHGWHIIRMDAVAPGQVLPFEAVRAKIGEAMEKAAWARQSRSFIAQLVAASDIKGADLNSV